jgi:hypothetical protein
LVEQNPLTLLRVADPRSGGLMDAATAMNHSVGYIAHPLLGEGAGVREDHLSSIPINRYNRPDPPPLPVLFTHSRELLA